MFHNYLLSAHCESTCSLGLLLIFIFFNYLFGLLLWQENAWTYLIFLCWLYELICLLFLFPFRLPLLQSAAFGRVFPFVGGLSLRDLPACESEGIVLWLLLGSSLFGGGGLALIFFGEEGGALAFLLVSGVAEFGHALCISEKQKGLKVLGDLSDHPSYK